MKLHIGGTESHPEWKIFDIEPRPEVDFLGNAAELGQFADNSIEAIYCSHVLEHFHFALEDEVERVLKEWLRVLAPGGKLYVSVPDLNVLCCLYQRPKASLMERFHVVAMMFGSQENIYDVHKAGFDYETLSYYLNRAGYSEWTRMDEFQMFNDCSGIRVLGTLISLNVVATKAP